MPERPSGLLRRSGPQRSVAVEYAFSCPTTSHDALTCVGGVGGVRCPERESPGWLDIQRSGAPAHGAGGKGCGGSRPWGPLSAEPFESGADFLAPLLELLELERALLE